MDSLKRLFGNLQFIARYQPGDPVPREIGLYKTVVWVERFWTVTIIAAMAVGACFGLGLVINDPFGGLVTVILQATGLIGGQLLGGLVGGWLFGRCNEKSFAIHESLRYWYEYQRPNELAAQCASPSGPTSSSGSDTGSDEPSVTCHVTRHDDGGDYGFIPVLVVC